MRLRHYSTACTIFRTIAPCRSKQTSVNAIHTIDLMKLSSKATNAGGGDRLKLALVNDVPVIGIPMPSANEGCRFSLKLTSDTVSSLCHDVSIEDEKIRQVRLYSLDGNRIAGSTSITHLLLLGNFKLCINEAQYDVDVSAFKSKDNAKFLRNLESSNVLFNFDDFKSFRERQLVKDLENVQTQMKPFAEAKSKLDMQCETHAERVIWGLFAAMGIQAGFFARLTWWEYSWDIMEPITYFATFATMIASFAYYIHTRQAFEYPDMKLRSRDKYFYKLASKNGFDVSKFNELSVRLNSIENDLKHIRDPLYQHMLTTRSASPSQLKCKTTPNNN